MPNSNLFAAPAGQSALAQNTSRPLIPRASGGIQYNFCKNPSCEHFGLAPPLKTQTAGGANRYQCSKCRKTFAVSKPTHHQRDTYPNKSIFKLLINKVPFARIVSMLDISWHRFYHRIA